MKERRLAVSHWSVIGILCFLLLTGCPQNSDQTTPPPANNRANDKPGDVEHRIAYSGETLAIIANWYTGKSTNWPLIRDANPGLRPERLNLGQVVRIPGDLVVERNPLPRRVLQGSSSGKRSGKGSVPSDIKTDDLPSDDNPPTDVPTGDTVPPMDTPPADAGDANSVDLEQLLKEQIEAQKKNAPSDAPPPVEEKKNVPPPAEKAPEKAPAVPGDSEREQLLDELLTQ